MNFSFCYVKLEKFLISHYPVFKELDWKKIIIKCLLKTKFLDEW